MALGRSHYRLSSVEHLVAGKVLCKPERRQEIGKDNPSSHYTWYTLRYKWILVHWKSIHARFTFNSYTCHGTDVNSAFLKPHKDAWLQPWDWAPPRTYVSHADTCMHAHVPCGASLILAAGSGANAPIRSIHLRWKAANIDGTIMRDCVKDMLDRTPVRDMWNKWHYKITNCFAGARKLWR